MNIRPFLHSGFWTQTVVPVVVGLLLMLLPDWGHELRAQSLSPASHDFGTVLIGSSKTTTFTIQNSFATDIGLSSIQASAPFSAANGCPGLIAPGASCTIQVSFTPTVAGSYSRTLSVTWSPNGLPPPPPGEPPPGGTLTASLTGVAPPVLIAVDDSATTSQGTLASIPVLANDTGGVQPLSISVVGSPSHGTATISGKTINYTPTAGFSGADSFVYTVEDAIGQIDSATVTITVPSVAPPPALIAVPDSATTSPGTPVSIPVLANDTGGTPPLTISAVTAQNSNGTVSIDASQTQLSYTPNPGFTGTATFSYTVRDKAGQTDSATVTVTVTAPPPVPPPALIAVDDSAATPQGTSVSIPVLANDAGGTPPLTISAVAAQNSNGTVTIDASQTQLSYTPNPGFTGTATFSYTVRDKAGQTDSATVTVEVTVTAPPPAPPAPIAIDINPITTVGSQITIDVLGNITGGTPPLTIVSVTAPSHGTVTIRGGTIIYIPTPGYSGTDSFSYTVQDATGQISTGTITVTITASEKSPQELLEDAASNPNAQEVGRTIGNLCSGQEVGAEFLRDCEPLIEAAKNNSPEVSLALDQITPSTTGNAPTIAQTNVQTQMLNIRSRLSSVRNGILGVDIERLNIQQGGWTLSGRDLRYLLASVDGGGVPSAEMKTDLGALGVFASGTVNLGNKDRTGNQAGFDFKTFALTAGIDYRFTDQLVLGTAFSYVANDNQIDGNGGSLDAQGYSLTLYGTYYRSDNFYLDGIIDYGWDDYDQQRNVNYSLPDTSVRQRFNSDYGGQQFFVDVGAGYNFTRGDWTFGPEVRLSYLDVRVDPFQERANNGDSGSAWTVAIDEQNLQSLVSRVGGRVNYLIEQSWGVLQPQAELSWLHEFKSNNRVVRGQFVEGGIGPDNLFYLLTDPVDPDYFELSLGVVARFNKGPAALLQYRTLFGYDHLNQNAITAQIRWEF